MSGPEELSAVEQARAIRRGEVSPTELAQGCLDRIADLDPALCAFRTVTPELAVELAEAAEEALAGAGDGEGLSPLHGVPVAVKDVARIEDVRFTQGSAAFADEEADIDDHVVARMKRAGMVIVGTTNTPEFALPCYTENELGPPTRNPWGADLSPGGSSGGSAAAVAAGIVPVAHGTDAGGSVRIPASACGVVGLKPSRGRVSNGPIDYDVTGLSVHGALARTVADAAAFVGAVAGPMPGDSYSAPGGLGAAEPPGRPLRVVAMPEPMVPDVSAHADCLAALERTVELLEAAGHSVEEMEMSPDQGVADAFADAWSTHAARIAVDEDDEELLTPFTRFMRERGRGVTGGELHAALTTFRGIGQMMADMFFSNFDAILTPTLGTPPARIGEFSSDSDPAADFDRMTAFMPYTPLYNITGLPAVSLPLHWNDEGLPIGVMLGGRYGDEATLLGLAAQLEEAAGQVGRRPEALVA
ncbi:MAG TPA: amidase [Thermoleophilaceae bacterium]|nr:amidase [Thermoleophilaceae bacterium]